MKNMYKVKYINFTFCASHALGSLVSPISELNFETVNPFRYFDSIPWTGARSIAWTLPTQDSKTLKEASIRIRNHGPTFQDVQDYMRLRQRGHWDRLVFTLNTCSVYLRKKCHSRVELLLPKTPIRSPYSLM